MKKYVCTVCGYIAEGSIPEQCPVCRKESYHMLIILSLITVCIITGVFWYILFSRRERRLLARLQKIVE